MTEEFEKLERPRVADLDAILGQPFKVLDDGFVRVVDYMGSDESIVQAARVSYGKGTKKISEDRGLIRYLLRHRHTTPFEMCDIKFHVRVPMDAWRQWIRHRTFSVNEYSTRYSIAIDATQTTDPKEWRLQSKSSKQGSEGFLDPAKGEELSRQEKEFQDASRRLYDARIEQGVAREQARKDLLLSTYTEAYWKGNLHNLLHFLALRMDDHAQLEIREYATTIGEQIVAKWVPIVWEAFRDYTTGTTKFSRIEMEIVSAIGSGDLQKAMDITAEHGWLKLGSKGWMRNRERGELEEKLKLMNLAVPWRDEALVEQFMRNDRD